MHEELNLLLKEDNYVLDDEFTNMHKSVLKSYRKLYEFKDRKIEGIIITGVPDFLHKLSPVGTETAHLLCYLGVTHYNPDVVISCGYAGGSGLQNFKLGDIMLSKGVGTYYMREVLHDLYKPFIKGGYPVLDCSRIAKKLDFEVGHIGTADSFLETDHGLSKKMGISAIEMEFAAISRVCFHLKTHVIGMKIISDTPSSKEGEDRKDEFEQSLKTLHEKIIFGFKALVKYLSKE